MNSSLGKVRVDVSAFVLGSKRLDEEKSEIRLVLDLLFPYFEKMREGIPRTVFNLPGDNESIGLFCVVEQKQHSSIERTTRLILRMQKGRVDVLKSCVEFSGVLPDRLSADQIATCHSFLPALLEEMIGHYEEIQRVLRPYYAAAERTKGKNGEDVNLE